MSRKMIYLTRPTEYLYSAIGAIINQYGTLNPDKIKIVYDQLMMEAGLQGK